MQRDSDLLLLKMKVMSESLNNNTMMLRKNVELKREISNRIWLNVKIKFK